MNTLQGMSVTRRLSIGFGSLIVILICIVTITLFGIAHLNDKISTLTSVLSDEGKIAADMGNAVQEMRIMQRQVILETTKENDVKNTEKFHKSEQLYLTKESELKRLIHEHPEATTAKFSDLVAQAAEQRVIAFGYANKVIDLANKDLDEEAKTEINTHASPATGKLNQILNELTEEGDKITDTVGKEAAETSSRLRMQILTSSAIAVIVAFAIVFWLIRSIMRDLGGEPSAVREIVERVGKGDFTVQIPLQKTIPPAYCMHLI